VHSIRIKPAKGVAVSLLQQPHLCWKSSGTRERALPRCRTFTPRLWQKGWNTRRNTGKAKAEATGYDARDGIPSPTKGRPSYFHCQQWTRSKPAERGGGWKRLLCFLIDRAVGDVRTSNVSPPLGARATQALSLSPSRGHALSLALFLSSSFFPIWERKSQLERHKNRLPRAASWKANIAPYEQC